MVVGFRSYQAALDQRRGLDLDDLLIRAADLLTDDEGFAERMRWRYRHLSVDEFQDVNPAQFRLIRSLLGDARDLCVVGDPHQAIYGWNGADPSLLDRLGELLGPITVLELADNHRSTPQIVAMADAVLGHQRRYQSRSVVADGPSRASSPTRTSAKRPREWSLPSSSAMTRALSWSEQAVLARTNDQLSTIARTLEQSGIPHRRTPAPEASPSRSWRHDRNRGRDARPVGDSVASDKAGGGETAGGEIEIGVGDIDAVELATFHRSKGAEWASVCVTGLEEGFVPIVYAVDDEALAEERRLLYVALTRAGTSLVCSWATSADDGQRSCRRAPTFTVVGGHAGRGLGHRPRRVAGRAATASPRRFAGLRAELHGNR